MISENAAGTTHCRIQRATPEQGVAEALAEILLDAVGHGASVGFMQPLSPTRALSYWKEVLGDSGRIVLVAVESGSHRIVGTVQLVFATAENQRHRADVAKMLVHSTTRRRGIGTALLRAVEAEAHAAGRTLLVLDTATGGDAERLYANSGWQRSGSIPRYAWSPDRLAPCSTTVFYRELHTSNTELDETAHGAMLSP